MKVKSNIARKHADVFGMAASMGLITTKIARGRYGGQWSITIGGLKWLNETEN